MTGPLDGIRQLVSDSKAITAHTRHPRVIVARGRPARAGCCPLEDVARGQAL